MTFNTLLLHLRPIRLPERTLPFTHTFGLGGSGLVLFLLLTVGGALKMVVYQPAAGAAYDLVLAFNFTGYLLSWDQLSYWAVTIIIAMLGFLPAIGGALEYKSGGDSRALVQHYSTLAAAADVQWPLGFSVGGREARGGLFVAVRYFSDVRLRDLDTAPFEVSTTYEAGVSFATEPPLRLWKLPLPWLSLAWRHSEAVSGLRLYLAFPF